MYIFLYIQLPYFLIFFDRKNNSTTLKLFSEAWKSPVSTEVPQGFAFAKSNLGQLSTLVYQF